MARTLLTPITPARTGTTVTYTDAIEDGHKFDNTGKALLVVRNGAGAPINVTVQTPGSVDADLDIPDRTVAVANGADVVIRLDPNVYNQRSGADHGRVFIDYSATTSVSVAVISG